MRKITQDLKVSGIYCIINLKNSKRYIGSSKNIRQRLWNHRALLRKRRHDNIHLQSAWNKYGEQNFDFYVIERCDESLLLEKEQSYIDTMKPEYNINLETQRPPCSKESREKQSQTRKRLYAEGLLKPSFKHIKVYVYDLDGNFIKEYNSMKEAAIAEFGKNSGAVRNACLGKENPYHRVHDKLFYLEKLEKVPSWRKNPKVGKKLSYTIKSEEEEIVVLGVDGVANFLGTSEKNIRQYIGKNLKYKRKYMIYRTLPCN